MKNIKQSFVPFYIWWVQISLMAVAAYWAFYNGIFTLVYQSDVSHITQVIAVFLLIGVARIGWLSYKFGKLNAYFAEDAGTYGNMRKHIEEWNEGSTMFMMGGLLGTIVGFGHLAFGVLGSTNFENVDPAQVISSLLTPFGTVFFSAGVGVLSALIMKIQTMLFLSFSGISDYEYDSTRRQ